jgi:transposase
MTGVLRRLGQRAVRLAKEVAEAERALAALLAQVAPDLLEECGVGPICAAHLLVSSADPSRMTSEASFAALAGTSPVDASSGKQRRHRLNRGGDRQLNWALHVVASLESATTPRPPFTTNGYSLLAKPRGRHAAASSARSPATSTNACARCRRFP